MYKNTLRGTSKPYAPKLHPIFCSNFMLFLGRNEVKMKELLIFLAKSLVENPDSVKVEDAGEIEGVITYRLSVAQPDMGRIIGKQGRIAKAIRTVLKSASALENKRVNVEIVEAN